jgi:hypothetical protein
MTSEFQPYIISKRSDEAKQITARAFANGANNLPGVVISGRLNSPAVPNSEEGFLMNVSDFEKLCAAPPHTLSVVLEHAPQKVGRVLDIWKSERDQHLWVMAIINDQSERGKFALDLVRQGELTGFSIGNVYDRELYDQTNIVKKILVHEISLVAEPDDPSARFVAIGERPAPTVAVNLENWEAMTADVMKIYNRQNREPPREVIEALYANQDFAPVVRLLALMSK